MAPSSKAASTRSISQQAFDEVVKENVEELGMDPEEALNDAIETLTLQGVDLSGIVTSGTSKDNPVIQCLDRLKEVKEMEAVDLNEMVQILGNLIGVLSGVEASGFGSIAVKNGGVELVCELCKKIPSGSDSVAVLGLKALSLLLPDLESTEKFRASGGVEMVVGLLKDGNDNADLLNSVFRVVAMSATGNEVVKQSFMELKIDQIILDVLNRQGKGSVNSLYDAIHVLLTPDDNRVVASQVYGYARQFAKIGIAGALVNSLHEGLTSPGLVSASVALKAVAVNDEICKSIAERGGIDAILQCIDDSGEQGNSTVARTSCSLLSKLAGSDSNKSAIVEKRGMDRLIKLSARFSDDPSVLQEVMSIISVLCLRNPDNAARAVEAGAGDLAIQAMQKFPNSQQLQRNTCFMIRNLVVRNPENRTILLNNDIEKLIRRAKQSHESCKDAATDALRDLGVDNYNV